MTVIHTVFVAVLVALIGYGALYKTHKHKEARDPDKETQFVGVPLRFLSLMIVAYGSVAILALLFTGPQTFGADTITTAKAVNIGAIFSVVGAATADSLF